MARRFAEDTKVPVQKSQANILTMVSKREAGDFMSGIRGGVPFICFTLKGVPIHMKAPLVPVECRDHEQEHRRQWRVLELWVKAQLEAIDAGIMSPASAFMPMLQLKDGRTVAEAAEENGFAKLIGSELALPAPEGK